MQIIRHGVLPPPPMWWVDVPGECSNCHTLIRLERTDAVTRLNDTVTWPCPLCGNDIVFGKLGTPAPGGPVAPSQPVR